MKLKHLKNSQIDLDKYDNTVENCLWGRVYATSWYLNIVSPNWELLTNEDYSLVLPLPVKRRFGIKYIVQPIFCQQLGVFASYKLSVEKLNDIYKSIPYRYARLQGNTFDKSVYEEHSLRPNYFLNTAQLENFREKYNSNTHRNLKKAINFRGEIVKIDSNDYVNFIKTHNSDVYGKSFIPILQKLADKIIMNDFGKIYALKNNNSINAAVLTIEFKDRVYYLSPGSSIVGKEQQSMTMIVDEIIAKAYNKKQIVDFEGSSIDGVARFYKGFGSELEYYGVWKKIKIGAPKLL